MVGGDCLESLTLTKNAIVELPPPNRHSIRSSQAVGCKLSFSQN